MYLITSSLPLSLRVEPAQPDLPSSLQHPPPLPPPPTPIPYPHSYTLSGPSLFPHPFHTPFFFLTSSSSTSSCVAFWRLFLLAFFLLYILTPPPCLPPPSPPRTQPSRFHTPLFLFFFLFVLFSSGFLGIVLAFFSRSHPHPLHLPHPLPLPTQQGPCLPYFTFLLSLKSGVFSPLFLLFSSRG